MGNMSYCRLENTLRDMQDYHAAVDTASDDGRRDLPGLHRSLPPLLREWAARRAREMGLPGPDDYVLLLLRLEKQRQALAGVEERYREVFRPAA